jgi:hypothetical protein
MLLGLNDKVIAIDRLSQYPSDTIDKYAIPSLALGESVTISAKAMGQSLKDTDIRWHAKFVRQSMSCLQNSNLPETYPHVCNFPA